MEVEIVDAPDERPASWDEAAETAAPGHDVRATGNVAVPSPTPGDALQGPAGRRTRGRTVALAVAAAVVALVVVANVVEVRREAAEVAALAGVEGLVGDLSEPPRELWTIPGAYVVAETDTLLVINDGRDGLQAVRTQDGAVAWARLSDSTGQESCQPWREAGASAFSYRTDLLLCADLSYVESLPAPGYRARVDAVDAGSGRTAQGVWLDGSLVSMSQEGEHLVLVTVDPTGSVRVLSWDPLTGEEVWAFSSRPGMLGDAQTASAYSTGGVLRVTRYDLSVDGDGAETDLFALDLATGERTTIAAAGRAVWSERIELPDGGTAVVTSHDGAEGIRTVISDDDVVRFEVEGWPWGYPTDDGSAPEVLVVAGDDDTLRGLRASDGEVLWQQADPDFAQPMIRLRGMAVLMTQDGTRAVDLRTGEELWSAAGAQPSYTGVTDGRRLVLVAGGGQVDSVLGTSGSSLVAHDLADGEEVWRIPISPASGLRSVAGVLLVEDGSTITAYG